MRIKYPLAAAAMLLAWTVSAGLAQDSKPERLRGVIEKVDGNTVLAKSDKGADVTIHLGDKARIARITAGVLADIRPGSFIGSGAMPQPDGTQKAVEVHIFAESLRGLGEGSRPWSGAAGGSMTNGTVGDTVTGVDGPVITVKYKGGEQKIVVTASTQIVHYDPGDASDLKPGAAFTVAAAVRQPDGSFNANGINVGSGGVVPP
jgi:hypothetical protein